MSKSKIRMILFLVLCFLVLAFSVLLSFYYYPKLPSDIAVRTREDGSIATRWSSFGLYILSMIYVSIFLVTLLVFKIYDKVTFKNKKKFEKQVSIENQGPVYDLIKESVFAISFFLGLCILYLQVEIVKLGLGKPNNIRLIPLALIFLLFLFTAVFYNKKIEKNVSQILEKNQRGSN